MSSLTLKYDDTLEKQLNSLISRLDEAAFINTNPVEVSSYLGVTMAESEEGFQQRVEKIYNKFYEYMDGFAKECINTNNTQSLLNPTISRIAAYYKNSEYTFTHSQLRLEWKNQARYFSLPNPNDDFNIDKEVLYTRQAYKFFHRVSSIQLFFIEKIQTDLNSFLAGTDGNVHQKQPVLEPEYFFTIQPEAKKYGYDILQYIHRHLKEEGYINCTLPQFRKVFLSQEPKPIVWLKEYIHLSYLIKHMGEKFLATKTPNNYDIAHRFIHNKVIGTQFTMKNLNHDKDSKDKRKVKFFAGILRNSIDFYLQG
jgi:hypothetical protein